MNLADILLDKGIKKLEARTMIVKGILDGSYSIDDIEAAAKALKNNKVSTLLEAIEEITNKGLMNLSVDYLKLAKNYIAVDDNSCKREASRIIGNMASIYPDEVHDCISALLHNTKNDGTVVRWGSAYALSRIIVLADYCNTDLYETLITICESESENGVKNQYLKAFRKIKR